MKTLTQLVGLPNVRRVAGAFALILLLIGAGLAASQIMALDDGWTGGVTEAIDGRRVTDRDSDGLGDALENRLGSIVDVPDTLGHNVSDGWLHHWYGDAVEWDDPTFLERPALVTPQEELPATLRGNLLSPTVKQVFAIDSERLGDPGKMSAWWTADDALDPRQWDNDADGIADAWLVTRGLHPMDVAPDDPAPGDPSMSLREKYEAGLDPDHPDTDGDGLLDLEELSGFAALGGTQRHFEPTDPLRFSSRGDPLPDGYVVRFGLDPHDPGLASSDPAGDGLSVLEAYEVSTTTCADGAGACELRNLLVAGPLVDPLAWDTFGDGTADVWDVRDPNGMAHALKDGRAVTVYDSAPWDAQAWGGDPSNLEGLVVDALNPKPSVQEVDLVDLYSFLRPGSWNEVDDGPWLGGLPTVIEPVPGALPPAVALRGWMIEINSCLGCNGTQDPRPQDLRAIHVSADPRKGDTDQDGLSDLQEYFGVGPDQKERPRTNPNDPDSDGDGLSDLREIQEAGTDPVRVDSSGSFLSDGDEWDYWTHRRQEALQALATNPTFAHRQYSWLSDNGQVGLEDMQRLGPLGTLHGDVNNILSSDSDSDGIADGAELFPNLFLGRPTIHARPATDPARTDSDGDTLPDEWEVRWSQEQFYGCKAPCSAPEEINGWPIDPSCWNSLDKRTCADLLGPSPDDLTDAGVNLAGDEVRVDPGEPPRAFTNRLAYLYDLHPFKNDTDGNGIQDMFAIQWGIEGIPDWAHDEIQARAVPGGDLAWVRELTDAVAGIVLERGASEAPAAVIIHPSRAEQPVTPETNLLELFSERAKGTWIVDRDPEGDCESTRLPAEADPDPVMAKRAAKYEDGKTPSRVGLEAACWQWVGYNVAADAQNGTDPWRHDFDDDGLPDAWEAYYGTGEDLRPADPTPASLASGCGDPSLLVGLPTPADGDHCLSYLESYVAGVDPTVTDDGRVGDTDGGGLVDWIEVALGLKPLDPLDDHGDEDWDGDGILNWVEDELGTSRLLPDTDGDGLLDGDWKGLRPVDFFAAENGNGDFCLRYGDDEIVASPDGTGGMENRPFQQGLGAGNLTHTQRLEHFLRLGVLVDYDPPDDRCPAPQGSQGGLDFVLFKREVAVLVSGSNIEVRGAGEGSDPLRWDTSQDGIPDGWLVFWRDRAGNNNAIKASLDPNRPSAQLDADQDIPTYDEYIRGRPPAWDEPRDGPWWGGLSPVVIDTDGDSGWFQSAFAGQDGLDSDDDSDGLPVELDPYPALDFANDGIISWNETTSSFDTRYTDVWSALATRHHAHARDGDGDLVPDFIDRARVRVEGLAALRDGEEVDELVKGDTDGMFTVTGMVVVDEKPRQATYVGGPVGGAGDGAPVANVTVKVMLEKGDSTAVIGVGTTQADGTFAIAASILEKTPAFLVDVDNMSVAGKLHKRGNVVAIETGAGAIPPGPARLVATVEPNIPSLQPLSFGTEPKMTGAVAYKDVGPTDPMAIPDANGQPGPALKAAMLEEADGPDGPVPNETAHHVVHRAEGVFAARSDPTDILVRATSQLTVTGPTEAVRVSEPLKVTGTFTDSAGAPLAGRNVTVQIGIGSQQIDAHKVPTTDDGTFAVEFATANLDPGTYDLEAVGELLDSDTFLVPPEDARTSATLSQKTTWGTSLRVNGESRFFGTTTAVAVAEPFNFNATLLDAVTGLPVSGRDVTARLSSAVTGHTVIDDLVLQTNDDGIIAFAFNLTDLDLAMEFLRLELVATSKTGEDVPADDEIFIQPLFPTFVSLEAADAPVGDPAIVLGTLYRAGPATRLIVPAADGEFHVLAPNGSTFALEGTTDSQGRFQFTANGDEPGIRNWSIAFLPHADNDFLLASAWNQSAVTHYAASQILMTTPAGLVGEPVVAAGRLLTDQGAPVSNASLAATWIPGSAGAVGMTDAHGAFEIPLPAQGEPGEYDARIEFPGTSTHLSTTTEVTATVRMPTFLALEAQEASVASDGAATGGLSGTLRDREGKPLPGRNVEILVHHPSSANRSLRVVTDAQGAFAVDATGLDLLSPGAWNATATFPGSARDAPNMNETILDVVHEVQVVVDRLPSLSDTKQLMAMGRLDGRAGAYHATSVTVSADGRQLGETSVTDGSHWTVVLDTSGLSPGYHNVTFVGHGPSDLQFVPQSQRILVARPVDVEMTEFKSGEFTRQVTFNVVGGSRPLEGVELTVLARDAETGEVQGTHTVVLDGSGRGVLSLDSHVNYTFHVVSISDETLTLQSTKHSAQAVAPDPDSRSWGWGLGAILATTLAAVVVTAYVVWRRRHASMLADAFEHAHQSLLDPNASTREVIKRAYDALLTVLGSAGYKPNETETVRDIAAVTATTFRLPSRPMAGLSQLFEAAVYSEKPMGEDTRASALQDLAEIIHAMSSTAQGPHDNPPRSART